MGIGDTVTVPWSHSATGFLGSDYRLSVLMQISWLGLWHPRTSEMGCVLVATIWIPSGEFPLLLGDKELRHAQIALLAPQRSLTQAFWP